jgi:hypothetical protein
LKLFTGGILGSEDDPLVKVFRVFEFVGGSITFHEERASVRLYITAKDLAPEK